MKILANKEIKNLFLSLSLVWGVTFLLAEVFLWLSYRRLSLLLLILFLLAGGAVWAVCFVYFNRQNQIMEQAILQINLEELLTVLNLKERRNHLPSQLSGGQQQRVAIGRALITRPSLILADEPTGNLDTQNSSEVITLLKEASKKYEQTIIMITHNRSIAQTADRVLQVSDGVLTDLGRCRE